MATLSLGTAGSVWLLSPDANGDGYYDPILATTLIKGDVPLFGQIMNADIDSESDYIEEWD